MACFCFCFLQTSWPKFRKKFNCAKQQSDMPVVCGSTHQALVTLLKPERRWLNSVATAFCGLTRGGSDLTIRHRKRLKTRFLLLLSVLLHSRWTNVGLQECLHAVCTAFASWKKPQHSSVSNLRAGACPLHNATAHQTQPTLVSETHYHGYGGLILRWHLLLQWRDEAFLATSNNISDVRFSPGKLTHSALKRHLKKSNFTTLANGVV